MRDSKREQRAVTRCSRFSLLIHQVYPWQVALQQSPLPFGLTHEVRIQSDDLNTPVEKYTIPFVH